ncbi:MAG: phosphotransacetylase family protein [Candidatus Methanoliparum thermophilum]|uniref:Phosphotransacetylase family protein n=1 Tax=Methanoliparum thermophilum TaxID=2491083 RepID=A0A520KTE3_METT2|nr:DRTGG domain-containing protein [Candidatus Methanoliparum sp. LAM-1]RZN65263.1 MAG: phosphotransacetylase family protein [Candidatus Methanoliparum thermophilum]BDC36560.1 hypothetical protein MTLP_12420 [Candidatus Methanoliparum sp. LAM-1]
MHNICVASTINQGGKTFFCVGIGQILREKGYNIGFMKPIGGNVVNIEGKSIENDVKKFKELFNLKDDYDEMNPVLITETDFINILKGGDIKLTEKIKGSFDRIKNDKDIVIIEGFEDIFSILLFGIRPEKLAEITDSKIILLVNYNQYVAGKILEFSSRIDDDKLIGIVINNVPISLVDMVKQLMIPFLKRKNAKILGFIPRTELLRYVTPLEIAENFGGKIICGETNADEPIYNFIIGAMTYENALKYFRRVKDKAVITGGDRAEIQIAALETPTKALLLTGNLYPGPGVISRAEERKIPIIILPDDTITVVDKIEEMMDISVNLMDRRRIENLKRLLEENIDLDTIYKAIQV